MLLDGQMNSASKKQLLVIGGTGIIGKPLIAEALEDYPLSQNQASQIPVYQRMNKLPRPKRIAWLMGYYKKGHNK